MVDKQACLVAVDQGALMQSPLSGLTKAQVRLLRAMLEDDDGLGYWECSEREMRTAISLALRNLIEFEGNDVPEKGCRHFGARIRASRRWLFDNHPRFQPSVSAGQQPEQT